MNCKSRGSKLDRVCIQNNLEILLKTCHPEQSEGSLANASSDKLRDFSLTLRMAEHRTKIKQQTKTLQVHKAKNWREKVQGLIGSDEPRNFLLKTHFGIHTIGLKFPIDVLILDKNSQVKVLKHSLRPNNMFLWNPKYDTVIELPTGEIKKHKIEVGEKVELELLNPN